MTKDERLLAIAQYGLEHPKIELMVEPQWNEIAINCNHVYYGEFYVQSYLDAYAWVYMDVLKGLVEIKEPKKPTSNYIQYQIDGTKLVPGYTYEEEVTLYYPGGIQRLEFRIKSELDQECQPKQEGFRQEKKVRHQPQQHHGSKEFSVCFEKMTYSLDEAIKLRLMNGAKELKSIIIESDHSLIHPQHTEFYLKDTWTQEWYIQQTAWDKIVGRMVFKETPFETITFQVFVNGEHEPSQSRMVSTTITAYPLYKTPIHLESMGDHRRLRIQCMRDFLLVLTERIQKKEYNTLINQIKACLNFDQTDVELRLIYLWALVDIGDMRTYEHEARGIRKYGPYFQKTAYYPVFLVLERMIKRRSSKRYIKTEEIDLDADCLILLLQTRYLEKNADRYWIYRYIYEKKTRYAILFAEAVHYLNKHEIHVEADDPFYSVCIQWALNQGCLGKSWAHRLLGREKIWIRKNPYITSRLLMHVYKVYPSWPLLQLCCEKAMEEKRYDGLALEFYKVGLDEGRFIKGLDRFYVEAVTRTKEPLDFERLRYMHFIKDLSIEAKGYIYVKMIEAGVMDYSRFSRIYQDLIMYLRDMTHETTYMQAGVNLLEVMKERMYYEQFDILEIMMEEPFIQYLYSSTKGQEILSYLLQELLKDGKELRAQKLYARIEASIGPERILQIYPPAMHRYEQGAYPTPVFLDNHRYKMQVETEQNRTSCLQAILTGQPHDVVMARYRHLLLDQQKELRPIVCEHLCRQMLIEDVTVKQEDVDFLKHCYATDPKPSNGLLLALHKMVPEHPCRHVIKERGIVVPWTVKKSGKTSETSIQYYGEPFDEITIFYRYAEDEAFHEERMMHIAFGLFLHPIYIFYGEYMEYYITKKISEDQTRVVVADIVYKQMADTTLDFIAFAMEVGDGPGAYGLIDEYLAHKNTIKKIFRI